MLSKFDAYEVQPCAETGHVNHDGTRCVEVIDGDPEKMCRCNNCLGIFDEDIAECPTCKTDGFLMQPFPHFWTVYGHISGQGVEALADCPTKEIAELIELALDHTIRGKR